MSGSSDPLVQWLKIQEQTKEEAENQVRTALAQLTAAEDQLQTLLDLRERNSTSMGTQLNGFQINSLQQFNQQMDRVIELQAQQVTIEANQKQRKDQQLKEAWFETRKTEMLLARNTRRRELIQGRKEQKKLDEMAGIILRRRRTSES